MFNWISSLFQSALAEIIFLSICFGSLVVTGFMLIFGGDHDGDADHGDMEHGDADHGDDHSDEGPKFFSIRGLSLFGTGFGGVGYIVQHYTGMTLVAAAAGTASGFLLALAGLAFIRLFFSQQVSSLVSHDQVIGSIGTVTTAIPANGQCGEIMLTVAGLQMGRIAMSADNNEIPSGAVARVTRVAGHAVVVERVKQ